MRLNNTKAILTLIFAMLITVAAVVVALSSAVHWKSSDKLLNQIGMVKPGINIFSVTNHFEKMMYEIDDVDRVVSFGSVKNLEYCKDKRLFWFIVSGIPYRALEIYTDKDNIVTYVTWRSL
jgi:hypothetical protein